LYCFAGVGLPYGYVATATGGATAGAGSQDRLGHTGGSGGGAPGGTTYYATASPDYASPVSLVSLPRAAAAGAAPTSPPIRADQYVLQRILHGQTSRLSLQDFTNSEPLGSASLVYVINLGTNYT